MLPSHVSNSVQFRIFLLDVSIHYRIFAIEQLIFTVTESFDIHIYKVTLKYDGPIVAPVQKDKKIADLIVFNKDEIVRKLPLYAAEDLKKVNFFKSLITSINYLIWGDV